MKKPAHITFGLAPLDEIGAVAINGWSTLTEAKRALDEAGPNWMIVDSHGNAYVFDRNNRPHLFNTERDTCTVCVFPSKHNKKGDSEMNKVTIPASVMAPDGGAEL